jgi:hypothetical protein
MKSRTFRFLTGGVLVALAVAAPSAVQAKELTDWGQAEPVSAVNDPVANDGCPIESPDGRSLYIASNRRLGDMRMDIWVATRDSEDADFGVPTLLPVPVNSDASDFCPTPLPGKYLLFVSTRGGVDAYGTAACGGGDIYITRRSPATGEWAEPRNLGCAPNGPNSPQTEFGPSLVETDLGSVLFFSSGGAPPGTNTQNIYQSWQLPDGSFGPPEPVTELNTDGADDMMPNVSKDGREVVFASNRPGGEGAFDIYSATRNSASDPWSNVVNLGPAVNTAAGETRPSLSWDGERLYFGRAGEIYVSVRSKG